MRVKLVDYLDTFENSILSYEFKAHHVSDHISVLWFSKTTLGKQPNSFIFCNIKKTSQIFVISCASKDLSELSCMHSQVRQVEYRFYKMQKQVIVGTPKLRFHINPYLGPIFQRHRSGSYTL